MRTTCRAVIVGSRCATDVTKATTNWLLLLLTIQAESFPVIETHRLTYHGSYCGGRHGPWTRQHRPLAIIDSTPPLPGRTFAYKDMSRIEDDRLGPQHLLASGPLPFRTHKRAQFRTKTLPIAWAVTRKSCSLAKLHFIQESELRLHLEPGAILNCISLLPMTTNSLWSAHLHGLCFAFQSIRARYPTTRTSAVTNKQALRIVVMFLNRWIASLQY